MQEEIKLVQCFWNEVGWGTVRIGREALVAQILDKFCGACSVRPKAPTVNLPHTTDTWPVVHSAQFEILCFPGRTTATRTMVAVLFPDHVTYNPQRFIFLLGVRFPPASDTHSTSGSSHDHHTVAPPGRFTTQNSLLFTWKLCEIM